MTRPAVTVTICLHNSSAFVEDALASVLGQTFSDFELLLVDDGSSDGTIDLIADRFHDDRIRIIRQSHQGIGAARAVSLSNARGEYIAFLDHDDVWAPEKLERQVGILRQRADIALLFSDSTLVDLRGAVLGRLGELYGYPSLRPLLADPYHALLTRNCFIDVSSVTARRDVLRAVGGFDSRWRFVEDYDLWLRVARRHKLEYVADSLVTRRVHDGQFTRQRADIALTEQRELLHRIVQSRTVPPDVRFTVEEFLCGQHRACARRLAHTGRYAAAARALVGGALYPRAAVRYFMGHVGARLPQSVKSAARGLEEWSSQPLRRSVGGGRPSRPLAVWIDGSALSEAETGFFNFSVELIRSVAQGSADRPLAVHVVVPQSGVSPLRDSLGGDAERVHLHIQSDDRSTLSFAASAAGHRNESQTRSEVVIWRGRFSRRCTHRVGVILDLTTVIHPDLHTPHNITEFREYSDYITAHADHIVTVSDNSRRDIIDRLPVYPGRVTRIPMSVHPRFHTQRFDCTVPARYGIAGPYILSVGTLEPRKNLRRLVTAFGELMNEPAMRRHILVLAGPEGWDSGFAQWVRHDRSASRVHLAGMVSSSDLPSLYHYADAFVYPSLYEGFGLPVLEAMWSSACVVTSSVSSLPEVLGEGGVYVNPRCFDDIARTLLNLIQMTPDRKRMYRRYCLAQAERLARQSSAEPVLPGLAPRHARACE